MYLINSAIILYNQCQHRLTYFYHRLLRRFIFIQRNNKKKDYDYYIFVKANISRYIMNRFLNEK